jgi:hypothetical protein
MRKGSSKAPSYLKEEIKFAREVNKGIDEK